MIGWRQARRPDDGIAGQPGPSRREGLPVISPVARKGEMRRKMFGGTTNAGILTDFLKRLVEDGGRKTCPIPDNLRLHHRTPGKERPAKNGERIRVFCLPRRWPEPDPDEMANTDLKQAVTKRAPTPTKRAPVQAARHLKGVQRAGPGGSKKAGRTCARRNTV